MPFAVGFIASEYEAEESVLQLHSRFLLGDELSSPSTSFKYTVRVWRGSARSAVFQQCHHLRDGRLRLLRTASKLICYSDLAPRRALSRRN